MLGSLNSFFEKGTFSLASKFYNRETSKNEPTVYLTRKLQLEKNLRDKISRKYIFKKGIVHTAFRSLICIKQQIGMLEMYLSSDLVTEESWCSFTNRSLVVLLTFVALAVLDNSRSVTVFLLACFYTGKKLYEAGK